MRLLIGVLALLMVVPGVAASVTSVRVVTSVQDGPKEVFRMGPGACVKGPMTVYDANGNPLFSVPAGTDYPAGCSKWR